MTIGRGSSKKIGKYIVSIKGYSTSETVELVIEDKKAKFRSILTKPLERVISQYKRLDSIEKIESYLIRGVIEKALRMKNQLRKYLSVERRDLWDNSNIYQFYHLSVDRLKYKLKHLPKKDRKMKCKLEETLRWRCKLGKSGSCWD